MVWLQILFHPCLSIITLLQSLIPMSLRSSTTIYFAVLLFFFLIFLPWIFALPSSHLQYSPRVLVIRFFKLLRYQLWRFSILFHYLFLCLPPWETIHQEEYMVGRHIFLGPAFQKLLGQLSLSGSFCICYFYFQIAILCRHLQIILLIFRS